MTSGSENFRIAKWIKATSLGWFLSIAIVLLLAMGFEAAGISELQFFMGIGMGLGVGTMQWRYLSTISGIGKSWIWSAVTGLGLPFLFFDILKLAIYINLGPYYVLYSVCIAGMLTGIFQFLILRKHRRNAGLWVVGCFIGWLAATATFFCINYTRGISPNNWLIFFINVTLILVGGAVLGVITGFVLRGIMVGKTPPA